MIDKYLLLVFARSMTFFFDLCPIFVAVPHRAHRIEQDVLAQHVFFHLSGRINPQDVAIDSHKAKLGKRLYVRSNFPNASLGRRFPWAVPGASRKHEHDFSTGLDRIETFHCSTINTVAAHNLVVELRGLLVVLFYYLEGTAGIDNNPRISLCKSIYDGRRFIELYSCY
jgi:hypothetical protein